MAKELLDLRTKLLAHLDKIHLLGKKINGTTYILSAPHCDKDLVGSAVNELADIEKELVLCKDNVKALMLLIEDK